MADLSLDQGLPHPATMTPRQRERRRRLIASAVDLLSTHDYDEASVKDVADAAGVSLGTLYNYFYSKERLFTEALVSWASEMPANLQRRPLREATPGRRLKEAMHRAVRAFERQPQMARLTNVLMMSTDPSASEFMARMERATSDAYLQALSTIDPARARAILDVVNAVFGVAIREWSVGRVSVRVVHDRLESAIDLVLPDEP